MRPATQADEPAILALLARSLGWVGDDHFPAFFGWKHTANSFGPSPAWVAVADGDIVGFRAFLRWELEQDGVVVPVVRAVDTATDPAWLRRGIFSRLTREGLKSLTEAGVAFVFNTPNDKSRPGYLKMGWSDVGQMPVSARPSSLRVLPRLAGARGGGGERWSLSVNAGAPATSLLSDHGRVAALLASQPAEPGSIRTHRTPEYLWWRYSFAPLHYRAISAGTDPAEGFVVFRVRRRGRALEAGVCEVLVPDGDRGLAGRLLRQVARTSGADYALTAGLRPPGYFTIPGQGPQLVWRALSEATMPPAGSWALGLGDVELF